MIAPRLISSYNNLLSELNDPRAHNAMNTGACAVRNQAIMQARKDTILPVLMMTMNGRPTV